MILACVGTQPQPFKRFFEAVLALNTNHNIVLQTGTNSINTNYKHYDYSNEFSNDLNKADIIITHGGVGSIMPALLLQKKVLVMPRLKKYDEHVDDHQLEICELLASQKYIYLFNDANELQQLIDQIDQLEFKTYISTNKEFNQNLKKIIKNELDA